MKQEKEYNDPEILVRKYLDNPSPEKKQQVINAYIGLVESVAKKFSGLEPIEDLVQVGSMGLLNALNRYDPDAEVKFQTYATHLIAGEMKHYLRDKAFVIRHPAWLQELRQKLQKEITAYQANHGELPSENYLARTLNVEIDIIHEVFQSQDQSNTVSLNTLSNQDDDDNQNIEADIISNYKEETNIEDRLILEEAISQLKDLEKSVLTHYHYDTMNQGEIAERLGISSNYVSHLLRQSLSKLRRILVSQNQPEKESGTPMVIDSVFDVFSEEYFYSRMQEEMHRASSNDTELGVILIHFSKLKQFKRIYGEEAILDFLVMAADSLKSVFRKVDTLCRFRSTGFGVLLPADKNLGIHRIEQFEKDLSEWLHPYPNNQLDIRLHYGHSIYPADSTDQTDLIEKAFHELNAKIREDIQPSNGDEHRPAA